MELTQELVRSLFDYHEDGYLIWKINSAKAKVGNRAGGLDGKRYYIRIKRRNYLASRLIFFYHTGEWPKNVDHKNHITTDDRFSNLRAATSAENNRNTSSRKNSSSQFLGVYWNKTLQKWHAQIRISKKLKHLGYFIEENKAALAYNREAVRYYKEFANLNIIPL